jgi:hypothetical protein
VSEHSIKYPSSAHSTSENNNAHNRVSLQIGI